MAQYVFRLEDFAAYRTRALTNDSITVNYNLQIGNTTFQPYVVRIGDVSTSGLSPQIRSPRLTFGPVEVAPTDEVKFAYIIINSGYDASNEGDVKAVVDALSDGGAETLKSMGPAWAGLGVLLNDLIHLLHDAFFANCDGIVAADVIGTRTPPNPGDQIIPLTGADLAAWTAARGVYTETRNYPGTNSPVGCGATSLYDVTWSVTRPDVKDPKDSKDHAEKPHKEHKEAAEKLHKDFDSAPNLTPTSVILQRTDTASQQVDNIAEALPTKNAFITPEERPSVGDDALRASKAP